MRAIENVDPSICMTAGLMKSTFILVMGDTVDRGPVVMEISVFYRLLVECAVTRHGNLPCAAIRGKAKMTNYDFDVLLPSSQIKPLN
jgi:hypothetical protein